MKRFLLLVLVLVLSAAFCSAGAEGSMLDAVYDSLDADAGVHLNYTMRAESMGVEINYDAQVKGISGYTVKTSQALGRTVVDVSCFIDDTAYILYPDRMEAQAVMTVSSSLLKYYSYIRQDELGKLMDKCAHSSGFQVETREVDGTSYTVEVYPSGDGTEYAFYFDETGRLVYLRNDTIKSLGELFYAIHTIDSVVDETLLDISAYTVLAK